MNTLSPRLSRPTERPSPVTGNKTGNLLAMPSARARQATPQALLRGLGHAVPIAIALWATLYFVGRLVVSAVFHV